MYSLVLIGVPNVHVSLLLRIAFLIMAVTYMLFSAHRRFHAAALGITVHNASLGILIISCPLQTSLAFLRTSCFLITALSRATVFNIASGFLSVSL